MSEEIITEKEKFTKKKKKVDRIIIKSEDEARMSTHVSFKCPLSAIFNFDPLQHLSTLCPSLKDRKKICADIMEITGFWFDVNDYFAFLRQAENKQMFFHIALNYANID